MLLHYQSHVTNQAIGFTDEERDMSAPQNSGQSQTCTVKISETIENSNPLKQSGRGVGDDAKTKNEFT